MFETIELLVTVKGYPAISQTYGEAVCVAGIRTDLEKPEWVRLFPIQFRDLPQTQRFHKYDVIRVRAERHNSDQRPETYRPEFATVEVVRSIKTNGSWAERRQYVEPLIVDSMCGVLRREREDRTSLAAFRPGTVEALTIAPAKKQQWSDGQQGVANQGSLLLPDKKTLEKIPLRFGFTYRCDEAGCRGHDQSIIDWELSESYRGWRRRYRPESLLHDKLRQKWFGQMCASTRDTVFFVGNQHQYREAFLVLGVFWPPAPKS